MKQLFLSIILVLFAISGFCQGMQPVKLDNEVTVSMPAGYQKKDTTNESIFSSNGLFGFMIVLREANAKNNTPLKKASDLNREMKTYVQGIQSEVANSSAQNLRDTTIGTLKAKVFTLVGNDDQGEPTYRNFLLLYTRDATYTFEYVYPEVRKDMVASEYKAFISSIRTASDLDWNDQYVSRTKGMSSITKIEIGGGAALVIVLVIVFVAKRRKPALG
jgi:hypothetical protein